MENPIRLDDSGLPLFQEISKEAIWFVDLYYIILSSGKNRAKHGIAFKSSDEKSRHWVIPFPSLYVFLYHSVYIYNNHIHMNYHYIIRNRSELQNTPFVPRTYINAMVKRYYSRGIWGVVIQLSSGMSYTWDNTWPASMDSRPSTSWPWNTFGISSRSPTKLPHHLVASKQRSMPVKHQFTSGWWLNHPEKLWARQLGWWNSQ